MPVSPSRRSSGCPSWLPLKRNSFDEHSADERHTIELRRKPPRNCFLQAARPKFDIGNDMVSSLKVGPGRSVRLFADDQFTGTNATYNTDIADLSVSSSIFNDSASSVTVY